MEVSLKYQLDPSNPQILFVLGGPGSGKGTQCERLVRDYHYEWISVGDVVREEANRGTPEGNKLKELMAQGILVSDHLVVGLLEKKIKSSKKQKYLIDGFPRNISQAKLLERMIKEIDLILDIHVGEEALIARLLERSKTSGRVDDNIETIKKRIHTFHEQTEPVIEYYKKFGKIKRIEGDKPIDEVYKQVKRAIKPNIIFFWGPPAVGKTTVARFLAEKTKYLYIDYEQFCKQNKCKTQQEKTNYLIEYCDTVPHMCILVDSFFSDYQQARVFFQNFVEPQIIFALESPKDEVMLNIAKYYPNEKDRIYQRKQYDEYARQREEILNDIKNKPYFKKINAADTLPNISAACLEVMRPLTLVAFTHHNQDLAYNFFDILEKQRGFIYCDMQELNDNEVERQTALGKKMGAFLQSGQRIPSKFQIELIAKIMFNEPDNSKFIFTNFPEESTQFTALESELYPIDFLLSFEREKQDHQFSHKPTPLLDYFAKGKEIVINSEDLSQFDKYVDVRTKFGLITGPPCSGKTSLAQHLAKQFEYIELIEWDKLTEQLKTILATNEGEVLEEVSYVQIENYLADKLNPKKNKTSKTILIDGFPNDTQLASFISKAGKPSFVIHLVFKTKDLLLKRYRIKNEIAEDGEADEETSAKINGFLATGESYLSKWNDLIGQNTQFYDFDNEKISLESAKRYLNSLFFKRVFIVNDSIPQGSTQQQRKIEQKLLFVNICRKHNITFIDVQALLQQAYKERYHPLNQKVTDQYQMRWSSINPEFPSHYSPDLIVASIKGYLNSLKYETREILLYGYPSADAQNDRKTGEQIYPRASDEFLNIEKFLGPIRVVVTLTNGGVKYNIEDPEWVLEKPKVEEVKKEEGDDEEQGDKDKQEGDEQASKFNKFDYQWTQSNGVPKNLSQWFVKVKKTKRILYPIGTLGGLKAFEDFSKFVELINEETVQNKEEFDYRKTNLYIQMRYDSEIKEIIYDEDPVEVQQQQQQ